MSTPDDLFDFGGEPEDHSQHGPECIHKQMMDLTYEDLLIAYTQCSQASQALDEVMGIGHSAFDGLVASIADLDTYGQALYAELVRRGSPYIKPSEN